MGYIKNVAIGLDQLLNTTLGGKPDETISAKIYRKKINNNHKWIWVKLEQVVNVMFFDNDHCYQSFISEVERKQFPNDYKNIGK